MRSLFRSLFAPALVLGLSAAALPQDDDERPPSATPSQVARAEEMSMAASAWLDSLQPELRAKAQLPFDDDERKNWGFVPRARAGVALGEMSGAQRLRLDALLRAALSPEGYMKAHAVVVLEEVLASDPAQTVLRDPGLYYSTVFGFPEGDEPWGWRLEGHHLSLNFTLRNGKFVASTPMFFGADPAEVQAGPHAGFRLFYDEEERAKEFVGDLGGRYLKSGVREEAPPTEIALVPGTEPLFEKAEGVSVGSLPAPVGNRAILLLGSFVANLHPGLAQPLLNRRYKDHNFNDVGFLWLTEGEEGAGFYMRISSVKKGFSLEYLNRGNHVHWVLRDAEEDFGKAQLEQWAKW